jgi:hypothetical protein
MKKPTQGEFLFQGLKEALNGVHTTHLTIAVINALKGTNQACCLDCRIREVVDKILKK